MEREEIVADFSGVEQAIREDGICASLTSGGSMRPLFRTHRDTVYIVKPEGTLRPRDIAVYKTLDGRYIMHRVYRVKENEYIIRGDNTYVTEHVPHASVIGVLMEFDRKGKHQGGIRQGDPDRTGRAV